MARRQVAPNLRAVVSNGTGWKLSYETEDAARAELRALLACARRADEILHGLDVLMNAEPMVTWRGRGYMVEKSARLRAALHRAGLARLSRAGRAGKGER